MKKILAGALCVILFVGIFAGCGKKQVIVRPSQAPEQTTGAQTETPEPTQASQSAAYPYDLTDNEISYFQRTLNQMDNYGFLQSDYNDIRDVNLAMVFYTGADIERPENYREIAEAYLSERQQDEFFCDYSLLTTSQINEFLQLKTGYSLSDMYSQMTWYYISSYDTYLHEHGDTNYMSVTCTTGRAIAENTYEIEYNFDGGIYDNDSNLHESGTVTLESSGTSLKFISNSLH